MQAFIALYSFFILLRGPVYLQVFGQLFMRRPRRVILSHRKSGFAFGEVEGSDGGFLLTRNADGAKLLLVAHDILLKGSQ